MLTILFTGLPHRISFKDTAPLTSEGRSLNNWGYSLLKTFIVDAENMPWNGWDLNQTNDTELGNLPAPPLKIKFFLAQGKWRSEVTHLFVSQETFSFLTTGSWFGFFKTRFHYVVQASLEHTLQPKPTLNLHLPASAPLVLGLYR